MLAVDNTQKKRAETKHKQRIEQKKKKKTTTIIVITTITYEKKKKKSHLKRMYNEKIVESKIIFIFSCMLKFID